MDDGNMNGTTNADVVPITDIATPDQGIAEKAQLCLNEVQTSLKKYGFDLMVFHELQTTQNANGKMEIVVQHVQKFVPIQPPK
jgi:hypothetical protein